MKKQFKSLTKFGLVLVLIPFLSGCFSKPFEYDKIAVPELHDLSAFSSQKLEWSGCGDNSVECAVATAPLDWDKPEGESIRLALAKLPATGAKTGTIFVNPGGPGGSGVGYVKDAADKFKTLRQHFDVIGWDPRGVGESTVVKCYDDAGMDNYLFNVESQKFAYGSPEWIATGKKDLEELGQACEKNTGALLSHVDTVSTVKDLDMLRQIVGDAKINYLGFSYGTYIGATYIDLFPKNVGRIVLDGALDPEIGMPEIIYGQTIGFENSLKSYLQDCLNRGKGCPFTGDLASASKQVHQFLVDAKANPITAKDGRKLGVSALLTGIATPLYAKENWKLLDSLFAGLFKADATTAFKLIDIYYDRNAQGHYETNSTIAFTAINCLDYPSDVNPNLQNARAKAEKLKQDAPITGEFQGYGEFGCAGWPVKSTATRHKVTGAGASPVLVVGTVHDPATPYQWAVSLSKQLENSTLLTFEGDRHTVYGNNNCVNTNVESYFFTGKMPAKDTRCA